MSEPVSSRERACIPEDIWLSVPQYLHKAIEAYIDVALTTAIAATREECAQVAEATTSYDDNLQKSAGCNTTGQRIAATIRSLGGTDGGRYDD